MTAERGWPMGVVFSRNGTTDDELVIRETPGVSGGYPCIGNTRISVRLIVESFRRLGSKERVADAFPQLSRQQVELALDYYEQNPARVDEDIERNERAWREVTSRPWPV